MTDEKNLRTSDPSHDEVEADIVSTGQGPAELGLRSGEVRQTSQENQKVMNEVKPGALGARAQEWLENQGYGWSGEASEEHAWSEEWKSLASLLDDVRHEGWCQGRERRSEADQPKVFDVLEAVVGAGFRYTPSLHGQPTLWCLDCGRDSGTHYDTCKRDLLNAPRSADAQHRADCPRKEGAVVCSCAGISAALRAAAEAGGASRYAPCSCGALPMGASCPIRCTLRRISEELRRPEAQAVPMATYNGLQRALEEANEMVCRHTMPYGWPDFQARWGLRTAVEVLAAPRRERGPLAGEQVTKGTDDEAEQGIRRAHAQRGGEGEGEGDRAGVRSVAQHADGRGPHGDDRGALSAGPRAGTREDEAGGGGVLRQEGDGERAGEQRVAWPWTGLGCDLCGFGSVENVDEFDPTKPCPECGTVATPPVAASPNASPTRGYEAICANPCTACKKLTTYRLIVDANHVHACCEGSPACEAKIRGTDPTPGEPGYICEAHRAGPNVINCACVPADPTPGVACPHSVLSETFPAKCIACGRVAHDNDCPCSECHPSADSSCPTDTERLFTLAVAVQAFRNLPMLGKLGKLRETKEYSAMCAAMSDLYDAEDDFAARLLATPKGSVPR